MKCTVNIFQDIGPNPNSNGFLDDTLQSLFVLLEQKGQSIKALTGKKITPEILEDLAQILFLAIIDIANQKRTKGALLFLDFQMYG